MAAEEPRKRGRPKRAPRHVFSAEDLAYFRSMADQLFETSRMHNEASRRMQADAAAGLMQTIELITRLEGDGIATSDEVRAKPGAVAQLGKALERLGVDHTPAPGEFV